MSMMYCKVSELAGHNFIILDKAMPFLVLLASATSTRLSERTAMPELLNLPDKLVAFVIHDLSPRDVPNIAPFFLLPAIEVLKFNTLRFLGNNEVYVWEWEARISTVRDLECYVCNFPAKTLQNLGDACENLQSLDEQPSNHTRIMARIPRDECPYAAEDMTEGFVNELLSNKMLQVVGRELYEKYCISPYLT